MCRWLILLLSSLTVVTLLVSTARADPGLTTNQIYMYSKPGVVQIKSGWFGVLQVGTSQVRLGSIGSGSGFLIHPDGYIVTNAHVVQPTHDGDDAGKRELITSFLVQVLQARNQPVNEQTVGALFAELEKEGWRWADFQRVNLVFLAGGARFPFEIKSYGNPVGEGKDLETGKDVSVIKIEARNSPTLPLGTSAEVKVGDKVWVIGFPGAANSPELDEKSSFEATTNDGSITATDKRTRDGTPVLQTNTNTTHGNSGGPAVNDQGEVIGLLTFRGDVVNGQEVQGFSFIVPIDTAKEFIRSGGTTNQAGGPVDEKWRTGLGHYSNKEYKTAKGFFSEIVNLSENHAAARKLIADSEERIARGEDQSGSVAIGLILVMILGGGFCVVVLGIIFFVVSRKKKPALAGGHPGGYGYAPMPMHAGFGAAAPTHGPGHGYAPFPVPPTAPGYGPPPVHPSGPSHPPAPAVNYGPPPVQGAPKGRTVAFSASRAASIAFIAGPLAGQVLDVAGGMVIGREPPAHIVIQDPQISGVHAWIGLKGPLLYFVDGGSTNGSFINDRYAEPHRDIELRNGEVVALGRRGNVKFVVRLA